MFDGYLGQEELYASLLTPDGFFRTGDQATLDGDGYVVITGRLKDLIIRGGVNISPVPIENVLSTHDRVQDVAVIGTSDARLGERICAVVVPRRDPPLLGELLDFAASHGLPKRMLPEVLQIVKEFPRTAARKVRKVELRATLEGAERAKPEMEMRSVTRRINCIDLHARITGSGPRVVLIHGLAEDSRSWDGLRGQLDGLEVHAYDLRGHGMSSLGAADGTLEQLADDLIGYLEQVGPSTVVGFSLGGTIGLWAASERADLVPHLIVIATSSVVGRAAVAFFTERIALLGGEDWETFREVFAEDNRLQVTTPDVDLAAVIEQRLEAIGSGEGYVNAARAMVALGEMPLTPRLEKIDRHVDVVGAEDDVFCPKKAAEIMLAALPDATYHEIARSGHLVTSDAPDELAVMLRQILQGNAR